MSVPVYSKPGINIDMSKMKFPRPVKLRKLLKQPQIKVVPAKNVPEDSQGVKHSRKATGQLIQSQKICDYFMRYNDQ